MNPRFLNFEKFTPHPILKFGFIIAVSLSATMALTSVFNSHPDEIHHFEAAKYYKHHFLPPVIGDPEVRASYSKYGVSYLNYHWIEYFLAGKFALLLSPLISDELTAVRFFNVFLFVLLAVFFAYRASAGKMETIIIFLCFLLVSPQIWYIFSYVNNDAFALFISLVAVYQAGYEKSLFNLCLEDEKPFGNIGGGIMFGLLIGILLTLKTNYYVILIFFFLWLMLEKPFFKLIRPYIIVNRLKKYCLVIFVAVLFLTFRCGMDFYVNGETHFVAASYLNYINGNFVTGQSKLLAYQEEVADYDEKPSTISNDLQKTSYGSQLKAKGVSFWEIFKFYRWHTISFDSFVGVFGYMNVRIYPAYYKLMLAIYTIMMICLCAAIFLGQDIQNILRLLIFIFCSGLTVFLSAYLSWVYAFQAQGRYLFPVIPMFGLIIYRMRLSLPGKFINGFIIIAFLLSACGFIIGLTQINNQI